MRRGRGSWARAGRRGAGWAAAVLALSALLTACGGPIDPNRPPLPPDYEPPPIEDGPQSRPLDRI